MTYYPDLADCTYFDSKEEKVRTGTESYEIPPITWGTRLRAVGWLDGNHGFATGTVSTEVRAKLKTFEQDPWQPCFFMGWHSCEICPLAERATGPRGIKNFFVPSDRFMYVAPELILHYIERHEYIPPEEFRKAVLASPPHRSEAYLAAVRPLVPPEVFQFLLGSE